MKDPKGNELKPVLLQIMDSDAQGPILLRVRYDHEKIDLSSDANAGSAKFAIVYAPSDLVLGEMRLTDLYEDFDRLKAAHVAGEAEKDGLAYKIVGLTRDLTALGEENRIKTEALRALQKERDPVRFEALIAERAAKLAAKAEAELATARSDAAALRSEVVELRAAKKRLKEANERLKERAK